MSAVVVWAAKWPMREGSEQRTELTGFVGHWEDQVVQLPWLPVENNYSIYRRRRAADLQEVEA